MFTELLPPTVELPPPTHVYVCHKKKKSLSSFVEKGPRVVWTPSAITIERGEEHKSRESRYLLLGLPSHLSLLLWTLPSVSGPSDSTL